MQLRIIYFEVKILIKLMNFVVNNIKKKQKNLTKC